MKLGASKARAEIGSQSTPPLERIDRVGRLMVWVSIALLAAVLVRVGFLQIRPSLELQVYARDRISSRPIMGYRGEILDRRGRLLSTTRPGYRVFLDPERLDMDTLDESIVAIANAVGVPVEKVGERVVRAVSTNADRRKAEAACVGGYAPSRQ